MHAARAARGGQASSVLLCHDLSGDACAQRVPARASLPLVTVGAAVDATKLLAILVLRVLSLEGLRSPRSSLLASVLKQLLLELSLVGRSSSCASSQG